MKNINKIKDDIYREIVERTVDGGEYSDEELYELIEEKVLKKSHEVYIAQSEKESIIPKNCQEDRNSVLQQWL